VKKDLEKRKTMIIIGQVPCQITVKPDQRKPLQPHYLHNPQEDHSCYIHVREILVSSDTEKHYPKQRNKVLVVKNRLGVNVRIFTRDKHCIR
jgi:hypothetical protein